MNVWNGYASPVFEQNDNMVSEMYTDRIHEEIDENEEVHALSIYRAGVS